VIKREQYQKYLEKALKRNPVVALIGPRQCGKTTLAWALETQGEVSYFDLEEPSIAMAFENAMSVLSSLRGLVVIDEAQRVPGLFPVLRVLADRVDQPATFLILGSASPELSRQASESLAGRVEIVELTGFQQHEVAANLLDRLWLRGGFPRSFLASSENDSYDWRRNFSRTFLERDLGALGFRMAPQAMARFWIMLAHYHGQLWNGNEIAASMGIAYNTASSYLDALEQTFMIRRLLPWHTNIGKRLVKTPKIYFRDTGLLHAQLGVSNHAALITHPKLGASWEGFALEQLIAAHERDEAYFYAIHSGSELDLYFPTRSLGIEIKFNDAPKVTRSMHITMQDLGLKELRVVYPGKQSFELAEGIKAMPLQQACALAMTSP
jgi:predicted AAA+ superfamily ATPase